MARSRKVTREPVREVSCIVYMFKITEKIRELVVVEANSSTTVRKSLFSLTELPECLHFHIARIPQVGRNRERERDAPCVVQHYGRGSIGRIQRQAKVFCTHAHTHSMLIL